MSAQKTPSRWRLPDCTQRQTAKPEPTSFVPLVLCGVPFEVARRRRPAGALGGRSCLWIAVPSRCPPPAGAPRWHPETNSDTVARPWCAFPGLSGTYSILPIRSFGSCREINEPASESRRRPLAFFPASEFVGSSPPSNPSMIGPPDTGGSLARHIRQVYGGRLNPHKVEPCPLPTDVAPINLVDLNRPSPPRIDLGAAERRLAKWFGVRQCHLLPQARSLGVFQDSARLPNLDNRCRCQVHPLRQADVCLMGNRSRPGAARRMGDDGTGSVVKQRIAPQVPAVHPGDRCIWTRRGKRVQRGDSHFSCQNRGSSQAGHRWPGIRAPMAMELQLGQSGLSRATACAAR